VNIDYHFKEGEHRLSLQRRYPVICSLWGSIDVVIVILYNYYVEKHLNVKNAVKQSHCLSGSFYDLAKVNLL
jgi:hypothetical protein